MSENMEYQEPLGFQLTGHDIEKMRQELDLNFVIAPYELGNVKGCGYNLTATEFVYSVRKKRLLTIHKSRQGNTCVKLCPNDTALILTREYIKLSGQLAGAFYSRVQLVSMGLGHISTTLDPGWKGMLLFAVNNPSRRPIRLILSESSEGTTTYTGIATMVLRPVRSDADDKNAVAPSLDNPPMRLDVLKRLSIQPKRILFDSRYQKFRSLIDELERFEAADTPQMIRVKRVRDILVELEKEFRTYGEPEELRGWMIELNRANYDELDPLRAKVDRLCKMWTACDREEEKRKAFETQLENTLRECDYLLLCEQIRQIHALIEKRVPHVWPYHTLGQLLGFLMEHWKVWAVYTIVAGLTAWICNYLKLLSGAGAVIVPAVASLLPPFISFFLDRSIPPRKN